jgi:hypothetical protein
MKACSTEDMFDRAGQGLGAIHDDKQPVGGTRPRPTRSDSRAVTTVVFSVELAHSLTGTFMPSAPIARVITTPRSVTCSPPVIRVLMYRVAIGPETAAALARSRFSVANERDIGERPLEHQPRERIIEDEVREGVHHHLVPVHRAGSWPLDLHPALPEGNRDVDASVVHRGPVRVVRALRASHLGDLACNIVCNTDRPAATLVASRPFQAAPTMLVIASCTCLGNPVHSRTLAGFTTFTIVRSS